jgi:hypothetical protein
VTVPASKGYVPTARLRFVEREVPGVSGGAPPCTLRILQQWWGQDLPSYMADIAEGEWRDVPLGIEGP